MIFIPFHDPGRRRSVLVVVIEPENLKRIQAADPITIESDSRGGLMPYLPYPDDTSLLIAFEPDTSRIIELAKQHDMKGIFEYLERGFDFKEEIDGRHKTIWLNRGKTDA